MRQIIVRKLPAGLIGLGFILLALANCAPAGAAAPTYVNAYAVPVGYGAYSYYGNGYGYNYGYPAVGYGYRDNRYCDDGNVIATPAGYFCANGSPLHRSGTTVPAYVGPLVVYTQAPVTAATPQTSTRGAIVNGQEFK